MSTKVVLTDNESIESALKKFRRKVQQDQILKEAKKNDHFMTRREKLAAKQKGNKKN